MSLTNKYKAAKGGSLRMHLIEAVNRYSSDAMVVLTPNDQLQNTSYRVSEHNFRIICKELSDGLKILNRLKPTSRVLFKKPSEGMEEDLEKVVERIEGEEESKRDEVGVEESKERRPEESKSTGASWTKLFKRLRFFARYEHFIKLDILC